MFFFFFFTFLKKIYLVEQPRASHLQKHRKSKSAGLGKNKEKKCDVKTKEDMLIKKETG